VQLGLDAAPGFSGGPVVDGEGAVVGVVLGAHPSGHRIAFAATTTLIRRLLALSAS
jgi:S1-C subfamily serine protease